MKPMLTPMNRAFSAGRVAGSNKKNRILISNLKAVDRTELEIALTKITPFQRCSLITFNVQ